jgi:predicted nucleic acid-binding protein
MVVRDWSSTRHSVPTASLGCRVDTAYLLASQGTPIGPYDSLIAAHAQALGVTLVTNDTREFERVPGL